MPQRRRHSNPTSIPSAIRYDKRYRDDEITYVLVRCAEGYSPEEMRDAINGNVPSIEALTAQEFADARGHCTKIVRGKDDVIEAWFDFREKLFADVRVGDALNLPMEERFAALARFMPSWLFWMPSIYSLVNFSEET